MKVQFKPGGIYVINEKCVLQYSGMSVNGANAINSRWFDGKAITRDSMPKMEITTSREATEPERRFLFDAICSDGGYKNDHYLGEDSIKAGTVVKISDKYLSVLGTQVKKYDPLKGSINFVLTYSIDKRERDSLGDISIDIKEATEEEKKEYWEYWNEYSETHQE